jgi:hypothetical protein
MLGRCLYWSFHLVFGSMIHPNILFLPPGQLSSGLDILLVTVHMQTGPLELADFPMMAECVDGIQARPGDQWSLIKGLL